MFVESMMPSNHLIPCCSFSSCPQSGPASGFFPRSWLFASGSLYWNFSVNPSSDCSGLISFRIEWFDLLAVQGTLESLLQHHSLLASILQCSAFSGGKSICLQCGRTQVHSLGWEDPLEKEMATHSRTLAWKIPWTEEPGKLQSMGSQRVGHNWATSLCTFWTDFFMVQLTSVHDYWKNHSVDYMDLCRQSDVSAF